MNQNYYRNQYLINSSRWHRYDYTNNGLYFVTICVQNRKCHLGKVKNGIMGLNQLGCLCHKYWQELSHHYPNCILDEFIVMPNHIHCIIEIDNNHCRDGACPVSTEHGKRHSLSNMVGSFKSACTREIHQSGYKYFSWQSRFYDHVLKINADSLDKIRYYIKYNPRMWDKDKNNLGNIKKYARTSRGGNFAAATVSKINRQKNKIGGDFLGRHNPSAYHAKFLP